VIGVEIAHLLVRGLAQVRARPMSDEQAGHRASDVYVPAEYRDYDLAAICQTLGVDVEGKFPGLKAKV
jgi:hypothetical protein